MKYLFIGAHLDDIELAAGGLIAKLIDNGHEAKMLCLSKSDYKNWQGITLRTLDQAMEEGNRAAEILGCKLTVFDFPNKDIPYNSEVVEAIEAEISIFQPDFIFTHNVNDTHQSHIGTAQSTLSAARRNNTVMMFEPIYPSGRALIPFRPDVYVDISNYLDKKIEALKAHKSQYEKYSDQWIQAVIARAKFRGFENGMQYAECFELCRMELRIEKIKK